MNGSFLDFDNNKSKISDEVSLIVGKLTVGRAFALANPSSEYLMAQKQTHLIRFTVKNFHVVTLTFPCHLFSHLL